MEQILIQPIILYIVIFIFLILFGSVVYLGWLFFKEYNFDSVILIDKSNRWNLVKARLSQYDKFTHKKKVYFLVQNIALLNEKGKALYIFSEDKPTPLEIGYNKNQWLSSANLMSIINNEVAKKIVKESNKFSDILTMFGSLGGILVGVSSVLVLLIVTGVIKGGV